MPMVDLHLHLLPGVDDGCKTMDDTVAMARTLVEGRPMAAAIPERFQCGACVEVQTVNPLISGSGMAATARPSIGTAERRCERMRALATTGASLNAASMSP